jgi:hypothetical protein
MRSIGAAENHALETLHRAWEAAKEEAEQPLKQPRNGTDQPLSELWGGFFIV